MQRRIAGYHSEHHILHHIFGLIMILEKAVRASEERRPPTRVEVLPGRWVRHIILDREHGSLRVNNRRPNDGSNHNLRTDAITTGPV
jgi:hypothetical protein